MFFFALVIFKFEEANVFVVVAYGPSEVMFREIFWNNLNNVFEGERRLTAFGDFNG